MQIGGRLIWNGKRDPVRRLVPREAKPQLNKRASHLTSIHPSHRISVYGVKQLLRDVYGFAMEIERSVNSNPLTEVSPLVLACLHTISGTFAWYHRENGSEAHLASLDYMRGVIKSLEPQWAVAGKKTLGRHFWRAWVESRSKEFAISCIAAP